MTRSIQQLVVLFALLGAVSLGPAPLAELQHHSGSKGDLRIVVEDNPENRVLTILLGPMGLPARSGHISLDPNTTFTIPFDGWLIAYTPQIVDDHGDALPGGLLHHADFFNTNRRDFICPPFPEYMFAAGREMRPWPALPNAGYPVGKGHAVRVRAMFHNPTDLSFPQMYLQVKIEYRLASDSRIKSVYPVWFSVNGCGETAYDLMPGANKTSSEFTIRYPGKLLAIGGHMHDYGRQLRLENLTRRSEIGILNSQLGPEGRFLSMPVVVFTDTGITVDRGDVLKVSALYDSPVSKVLANGAMGIVFGYFQPENDEEFRNLKPDLNEIFRWFNRNSNKD